MKTDTNLATDRDAEESALWDIADDFIRDLEIQDIGLIEAISIHLEGKMNEILNGVNSKHLSPQQSYEQLQESIWEEMKPMLAEKSPS